MSQTLTEIARLLRKKVILTYSVDPHRCITGILHGISSFGEAIIRDEDTGEIHHVWPALHVKEIEE